MNVRTELPLRAARTVASRLSMLVVAVSLTSCGGGGGDSAQTIISPNSATSVPIGSTGPTNSTGTTNPTGTANSSTPCKKSVSTGFNGNLAWQGTPPIDAGGGDGSSGSGGGSGGGDGGGGAAAGGDFGKIVGARVIVKDDTLSVIGEAVTDATGLVTIKPCGYAGPVLIEVHGQPGAKYFDEASNQDVDFPAGAVIKLATPKIVSNLAASTHSNAAVELLDLTVAAKSAQSKNDGSGPSPKALQSSAIDRANNSVLAQLDGHLPGIHRLQSSASVTRLPILLDSSNASKPNTLPDDDRGRFAATLAGLAKAARGFQPNDPNAMLKITRHIAADLSDGKLDLLKNGVPLSAPNELTYTYDSLWLSMTVGTGSTGALIGDAGMRSKVVPISRSSIDYASVPLSFVLNSSGKLQFSFRDELGVVGTSRVDGDYVELSSYAGREAALASDRQSIRLGANDWVLRPPTPSTSITSIAWLPAEELGKDPSLLIRDSNGAFWRNLTLNAPDSLWLRQPYAAENISVQSGFRNKTYALTNAGRINEWPQFGSIAQQTQLSLVGVVQLNNNAEHGIVLALNSKSEVYWVNRNEVLIPNGPNALSIDPATGLPRYVEPNAQALLIPNLPAAGICWISGSYLAGCDGSVYKVNVNATSIGTPECRSFATAITGLSKISFPAGVKIWRITTQKAPPYKATSCTGLEKNTGEVPIFYSETGNAFELLGGLTATELKVNELTAKRTRCIPYPDEQILRFLNCDDLSLVTDFSGTWEGIANPGGTRCRMSLDGRTGAAVFDLLDGRRIASTFNGDQFDMIGYWHHPVTGENKIVMINDRPIGIQGPSITFGRRIGFAQIYGQGRFGASYTDYITCDVASKVAL